MSVKRTPADIAFSKAIRESYDYRCFAAGWCPENASENVKENLGRCEGQYRHNPGALDCAHVHTRSHRNTRWNAEYGAVPLCRHHHRFFGDFPIMWADFLRREMGDGWYDEAKRRSWQSRKFTKAEQSDIAKHYREEIVRIEKLRLEGKQGHIKLVSYD